MQSLIGSNELQKVLEKGLVGGLWSIDQFNRHRKAEPVLPRAGFLSDHPEFFDKNFRDMGAYHKGAGRRDLF
jgi:hypothetical protein